MRIYTEVPQEEMTNSEVIEYISRMSQLLREITITVNALQKKLNETE